MPPAAPVWIAFALVYVFWGSTYLAISIAVRSIPPAMLCAVRFLISGPLMLAWCALFGHPLRIRAGEAWRLAVIGVLLGLVAPYAFRTADDLKTRIAAAAPARPRPPDPVGASAAGELRVGS